MYKNRNGNREDHFSTKNTANEPSWLLLTYIFHFRSGLAQCRYHLQFPACANWFSQLHFPIDQLHSRLIKRAF